MTLSESTSSTCSFVITLPTEGNAARYEIAFSRDSTTVYESFEDLSSSKTFDSLTASTDYTYRAKLKYTTSEGDSVESTPTEVVCRTGKQSFCFL